jgi:hypothetical protein
MELALAGYLTFQSFYNKSDTSVWAASKFVLEAIRLLSVPAVLGLYHLP